MWDWSIVSIIWLCLLIAAVLGGIIGYLLRHLFCKKEHDVYEGKMRENEAEMSRLRASVNSVKGAAASENSKDDAEISAWKKKVSSLESDLKICHERQSTIEGELKGYSAKAVGLTSAAGLSVGNADLEAENSELRVKLQEAESEKLYLLGRVKKAEAGETVKVVPMDQRDDLELVHGIGPVLERMLYDLGVYFFKDIAGWDTAKIAEINEKLPGFSGRIEREGWVESAKEEHFKKYGEKL